MSAKSSKNVNVGDKPMQTQSLYIGSVQSLIIISLVAIGAVPYGDILFAVFTTLYVYIMFKVVFPPDNAARGGWTYPGGPYFVAYVGFAGIIGLLIPMGQIIVSFASGDMVSVRESAPHLFLLSVQVISENLSFGRGWIPLPVKVMIPVIYNARRLLTLSTWAVAVFSRDTSLFWRAVVVSNVLFWNFNLWGFLLPKFLPWSLRTHYTAVVLQE